MSKVIQALIIFCFYYMYVLSPINSVVCRQLVLGNAIRAYSDSHFGSGISLMPIWLDDVRCTLYDRYLSLCSHNGWGNHNCDHSEDAGVACSGTYVVKNTLLLKCAQYFITGCTEGQISLIGSADLYAGRVEVCHNGEWGTVCDDGWDENDGIVACRQLGLPPQGANTSVSFGPGTGQILLDNLQCTGFESRLVDCSHNGVGNHDCSHREDAGIVCDCKYQTESTFVML